MKICCFSQPKAGTHLLLSLARELIGHGEWMKDQDIKWTDDTGNSFLNEVDQRISKYNDNFAIKGHIPYSTEIEEALLDKGFNILYIERDPREVVCSTYRWLKDLRKDWDLSKYLLQFDQYTALLHIIEGLPALFPIHTDKGILWQLNIIDRHSKLDSWKNSRALSFKYEELSGNYGFKLQAQCLEKLYMSLKAEELIKAETKRIATAIITRGSQTYHTAKADTWKEILHPYHLHRILKHSKGNCNSYELALSEDQIHSAYEESNLLKPLNSLIESFDGSSLTVSDYNQIFNELSSEASNLLVAQEITDSKTSIPSQNTKPMKPVKKLIHKLAHTRIATNTFARLGYCNKEEAYKGDIDKLVRRSIQQPVDLSKVGACAQSLVENGRLALPTLMEDESVGLELGVAEGYFSEVLLNNSRVSRLLCIDAWADHHNSSEYVRACARLSPYGQRCILIRSFFEDALILIPDNSLDFIYFDAYAHTGQQDGRLFTDWYPKLKEGGLCSGHDYDHEHWPQTVVAVDRFAASLGKKIQVIPGAITNNPQDMHPSWYFYK